MRLQFFSVVLRIRHEKLTVYKAALPLGNIGLIQTNVLMSTSATACDERHLRIHASLSWNDL